jgi:hypothetical protein
MNANAIAQILAKLEAAENIVTFEDHIHAGDWVADCIRQWETIIRA